MLCGLLISVALAAAQPADPAAAARAERYEQLHRETGNPALLWLIAEAQAQAGRDEQAIATLERVAGRGLGFTVTADSPLSRLAGKPRFDALAARLEREFRTVRSGREAATIALPGVVPEGIAADARTGRLFVGDMTGKRVLVVRPGRKARPFAATGALRPLGMTVDRARRLLWVAATGAFIKADQPASALLAFDLGSGRLRRTHSSPELQSINDVALAANGDVYATDSLGGALFRLRGGTLERVTPAGQMAYPNGVAVSSDGRFVYVAQGVALRRFETATGTLASVAQPANVAIVSIDGLYWHEGSLIGVQNNGNPGRVVRFALSPDGSAVSALDVLEAGNPDFDIPTTAAIAGDTLYLIANSQLTRLGEDGKITAGAPLKPIKLLAIPLGR